MFQYTTETIINSDKGKLTGNMRAGFIASQTGAFSQDFSADSLFVIDGVGSFKPQYIKYMSVTPYAPSENEEWTLTVPASTAGDVLRLAVSIREDGRESSLIQNAYLKKQKPFFYEVISEETAATDAENLAKLITKEMSLTDFDYFEVSVAGAVITFKAKDEYIRFVSVELDKVLPFDASVQTGQALLGFKNYEHLASGAVSKHGSHGAGTVEHLIKDLRIPTNASINPFAADHGGLPVPGGEYTQWLIEYETPRAHVSAGVMGSVGEVSRTSHILFVNKDATKLTAALTAIANNMKEKGFDATIKNETDNRPQGKTGSVQ